LTKLLEVSSLELATRHLINWVCRCWLLGAE